MYVIHKKFAFFFNTTISKKTDDLRNTFTKKSHSFFLDPSRSIELEHSSESGVCKNKESPRVVSEKKEMNEEMCITCTSLSF